MIKPKRHCIFCGEQPSGKTREHVLPQWLIKLTGDPKRPLTLPLLYANIENPLLQMAFDQFQFPACDACNNNYSELETCAKPIIERILQGGGLSNADFRVLFDWLDKVRVGIWLGIRLLDKNYLNIEPNFYIERRIGTADRAMCISRLTHASPRLSFSGATTLAFKYQPSCFGLFINNVIILSVSSDFLIARRMGLPYPSEMQCQPDGKLFYLLQPGLERIIRPILALPRLAYGTWFFQPMVNQHFLVTAKELWDTEYTKKMISDIGTGVGEVFQEMSNGFIQQYPTQSSNQWLPTNLPMDAVQATVKATKVTLEMQGSLLSLLRSDQLSKERKKKRKQIESLQRRDLRFLLSQLA